MGLKKKTIKKLGEYLGIAIIITLIFWGILENKVRDESLRLVGSIVLGIILTMVVYIEQLRKKIEGEKRAEDVKRLASLFNAEYYQDASLLNNLDENIDEKRRSRLEGKVDLSYTGIPLFKYSREVSHLLVVPYKKDKVYFFDYKYSRDRSNYSPTLALYKLNNFLPAFYLTPQKEVSSIDEFLSKDIFGGDRFSKMSRIKIEGYDRFSKIYYLKGENKELLQLFFTPERIRYFEENPNWTIYSSSTYLCAFKSIYYLEPHEYERFIRDVLKLLDVMLV